jgi:hypothetical protein
MNSRVLVAALGWNLARLAVRLALARQREGQHHDTGPEMNVMALAQTANIFLFVESRCS